MQESRKEVAAFKLHYLSSMAKLSTMGQALSLFDAECFIDAFKIGSSTNVAAAIAECDTEG